MSLQCVIVVLLGIANVEEFSLLVEGQKEEREEVEKMGTLKRVCICCSSNFTFGLNFSNQFKFFKLV